MSVQEEYLKLYTACLDHIKEIADKYGIETTIDSLSPNYAKVYFEGSLWSFAVVANKWLGTGLNIILSRSHQQWRYNVSLSDLGDFTPFMDYKVAEGLKESHDHYNTFGLPEDYRSHDGIEFDHDKFLDIWKMCMDNWIKFKGVKDFPQMKTN